ncbi:hypothetical protein ALC60_11121 [Trachymyrmex zeteki]|uniref:Uncharacterized protein n=1 Tax=Mycetomoellerius zeteki TaxID=64791 RepID=A0A151WPH4_9HYME|nr:hypothetical protein ALC60_11121 [Trachymyrmex zeteki]
MMEINHSQYSALSDNSNYSHLSETDISYNDNASRVFSSSETSDEFQINPQFTLLNIPKPGTHDIKTLSKGQYVHYGLLKALISIGNRFPHAFDYCDIIYLDLNIDGLPISKSSKSQLWPILGRISGLPFALFVIGIYHGSQKACLAEFLQLFVDEYLNLKNNGFSINKQPLQINIRTVICDSPARAYVTCTKSHNGHIPLRTDIDFINKSQPDHHLQGIFSPFELISIPMVSHFRKSSIPRSLKEIEDLAFPTTSAYDAWSA